MKKIIYFNELVVASFSCSQDSEVSDMNVDEQNAMNLDEQVAAGMFDNSNLGIYEGVFTTLDGQNQATIRIEMDSKNNPLVMFVFPEGDMKSFRSNSKAAKNQINNLHFESDSFEFDFDVNDDGSNPVVSNITYMEKKGDVIIFKETSKSAVSPRTGTYSCIDCGTHPDLGVGKTQTFNAVLRDGVGSPESNWDFQFTLGSKVYLGTGAQSGCETAFGLTTCDVIGEGQGGSGPFYINGSHTYYSADAVSSCSRIEGNILYDSYFNNLDAELSFKTNGPTGEGNNCP